MNPKLCRRIVDAVALVVLAVVLISNFPMFDSVHMGVIIGATVVMICDIIFALIFLRCPHCKKLLNFKDSLYDTCPRCGNKISP